MKCLRARAAVVSRCLAPKIVSGARVRYVPKSLLVSRERGKEEKRKVKKRSKTKSAPLDAARCVLLGV